MRRANSRGKSIQDVDFICVCFGLILATSDIVPQSLDGDETALSVLLHTS